MGKWIITLDELTPSMNTIEYMHWAAKKQLKEYWFMKLRAAATSIPKCTGKRRVIITRYCTAQSRLDFDNFVGGCKQTIIDRLKPRRTKTVVHTTGPRKGEKVQSTSLGLSLIPEDDVKNVEVIYLQELVERKAEHRTEIVLEDI